jgi:NADH-quinone oxidoreductase subunit C
MKIGLEELARQFEHRLGSPNVVRTGAPAADAPSSPSEASSPAAMAYRCRAVDYAAKGYHGEIVLDPAEVVAAAEILERNGFVLELVTGVDWIAENQMEVVYDYFHPEESLRIVARTRVPRDHPEVPTLSHLYAGADWHERETHEFFGIHFTGHPNLTPLLLPEDALYHPLRKDFVA